MTDTIAVLDEAAALERAGGRWRIRHACAVTGYSERYLRYSGCPMHHEEGEGAKGKMRVVLIPAEVRTWYDTRLRRTA